jgi:hypothetical protein
LTKLRDLSWKERDRNSQLANALYPHLADPTTQKQLLDRAAEDGGQGRAGLERRMKAGQRDYRMTTEQPAPSALDRVPGLVRKPSEVKSHRSSWEK